MIPSVESNKFNGRLSKINYDNFVMLYEYVSVYHDIICAELHD
jgi:hypothetical protein